MTISEVRSRLKALRTMHDGTCPKDPRHHELWVAEDELIKALDALLLVRLNLRLEQQKAEAAS